MVATARENDPLTERIIGFAIEDTGKLVQVFSNRAYQECLCFELKQAGIAFRRQVALPVIYKSIQLDCGYRLDIVVESRLILESKTVERLLPIHESAAAHLYEIEWDAHLFAAELQHRGAQRLDAAAHAVKNLIVSPPHW